MLDDCITLMARPRGARALDLIPGGAALHRHGRFGGVDREYPVEAAHVERHAAGVVGVAALAVVAAGDGDLEPAGPRVPEHRLELLDLVRGRHPVHPHRVQPRDVGHDQRVPPAEQVAVRGDETAEVEGEAEQHDAQGRGQAPAGETGRCGL
jgi:hypothetical protein